MTDTVLIETRNLTKSFGGLQVLKGVDLQVHQGEAIAIIGPSGGGKSTFLRCLNLLETPDGGDVIFEGQKINQKGTDVDQYRQKMGMVFQHFNVFPHMTVLQNITLAPVLLKKKTPAEAEAQALSLLERIGLLDKKDEYPRKLSGGQKQRLSIARVFLKDPAILILDEATSALDNTTEVLIQHALDELCKGRTTLVVAHRLSTIRNADEIAVVINGRIKEQGTHEELMQLDGTYKKLYSLQFRENDIFE